MYLLELASKFFLLLFLLCLLRKNLGLVTNAGGGGTVEDGLYLGLLAGVGGKPHEATVASRHVHVLSEHVVVLLLLKLGHLAHEVVNGGSLVLLGVKDEGVMLLIVQLLSTRACFMSLLFLLFYLLVLL